MERVHRVIKGIGALAAIQLALIGILPAQQAGITKLFPAQPTGYVTDVANLLDGSTRQALEARLEHLRAVTGAEVAVVTLPTIGDYAPVDVATQIGRAWGVGAKAAIGDNRRNAGVVFLLVPHTAEHKGEIFIAPGLGLEGAITDAKAGQIRDAMVPALSQQNYGAGLDVGTSMIADLIARELGVQDTSLLRARPPPRSSARSTGSMVKFVIYALIFIIWIISLIARNRGGRGGRGGGIGGGWILPYMIGRSFGGGGGFGGGGFGGGGGGGFGGFGGGGGFSGGGAGGSF